MPEPILKIQLNNYPREIKLSDKQKPKVDKFGKVTNAKRVGLPKYHRIRGNEFFSSSLHEFIRLKIINELHVFWLGKLKRALEFELISPIKNEMLPVHITFTYCTNFDDILHAGKGDIDNYSYVYSKTLLDMLHNKDIKVLPDDSVQYVLSVTNKFKPISIHDCLVDYKVDRCVVIEIFQEEDKIIRNLYLSHFKGTHPQTQYTLF